MQHPISGFEIKFLIDPTSSPDDVIRLLELNEKAPKTRTIAFFDTGEISFFEGIGFKNPKVRAILRTRSEEGKKGEATLKLRSEEFLPERLIELAGDKQEREFDYAYDRNMMDSVAVESKFDPSLSDEALRGKKSLKSLFNDVQIKLLEETLGEKVHWESLRIFGPVKDVHVWKEQSIKRVSGVTIERWELPKTDTQEAKTLIEVSKKTSVFETITTTFALSAALKEIGLEPIPEGTKTKTVLDHFAPGQPLPL